MTEQKRQSNNQVDMDIMHAAIDKVLAYGPSRKTRKGSNNGTDKPKGKQRKLRDGKGASHGKTR